MPVSAGTGPNPALRGRTSLIPLERRNRQGLVAGPEPIAAEGTTVNAFATGPRPSPLALRAAERRRARRRNQCAAPARRRQGNPRLVLQALPEEGGGRRSQREPDHPVPRRRWRRRGQTRTVFLAGPTHRSAWRWWAIVLYVANSDAVVRFPYGRARRRSPRRGKGSSTFPADPSTIIGQEHRRDRRRLEAVRHGGLQQQRRRERHRERRGPRRDLGSRSGARRHRIFASGLRNPVGMAWEPETGALWTAVNERDELGNDLVPDYMTSVQDGASTAGRTATTASTSTRASNRSARSWSPRRSRRTTRSVRTPHRSGSPSPADTLPARFNHGAFIGQHGSWNRKPRSGYKVIFVPFTGGGPPAIPWTC